MIVGGVYLPIIVEAESLSILADFCLLVDDVGIFFFTVGVVLLPPEFSRLVGGSAGEGVNLGAGAISYLGG